MFRVPAVPLPSPERLDGSSFQQAAALTGPPLSLAGASHSYPE